LLSSDDYLACLQDTIYVGESTEALNVVDPTGEVPHGGTSLAFEFADPTGETEGVALIEIHAWPNGNALAQVFVVGGKDDVGTELAPAALDALHDRLDAIADGDEVPTATPTEPEPTEPPVTPVAGEATDIVTDVFAYYAPNACYSADGAAQFGLSDCPLTDRLRTRLATWDIAGQDPICRCVTFPAEPTVGAVEPRLDDVTHVEIPPLGLILRVLFDGSRYVLDDTFCSSLPEGTNLLGEDVLACFQ
jgi:hypothetical protein